MNAANPGDQKRARARILDAAEEQFAEAGFDGTSLRQIALKANVPVPLVGYHFGSKLGLYRAIFEAGVPAILDQRAAGMALADAEKDPVRRLEMIMRAILGPMLRLRNAEGKGFFAKMLAREVNDPRAAERGILEELLDPIARDMIALLEELMPGRSKADAGWAYQIIVGTMFFVMADQGRISRMTDGACNPDDAENTLSHIIKFLLPGVRS